MDFGLNRTVNSVLDPILGNPYISATLKIFLMLYGTLAAPRIPAKYGHYFSNSYVRVFVMAMIMWIFNHDPSLSILIATVYFMVMNYTTRNAVQQAVNSGFVSPDVSVVISGGSGPNIKPQSVVEAEASLMQSSVNSAKATGFVTVPSAMLDSGDASTAANAGIPTVPSDTPANVSSMMAQTPVSANGVPFAFTPDGVFDLAKVA
jgi:hypothetical protein